ncbi:MAG: DUF2062 domain-containing protein [Pseudomonadota bacterium]
MPRKHFRKFLPDHDAMREHRHLRWARPLLKHPNLWHLNRHSVAGGVAAGMIGGLIPGPVQMLTAAILAIIFRVNLPVAVATTLLTNPLTWPFIFIAAYEIGRRVMGGGGAHMTQFDFDWGRQPWSEFLPEFWRWMMSLGETFLVGNVILAALLAVLGYLAVQVAWRLYLLAYLKRRKARPQRPSDE